MGYLGQATLTQSALTAAKALFDSGARNDPDVQKVLILFTDGRTYGGKQTLREPLKKLREVSVCLLLYKLVPKGRESVYLTQHGHSCCKWLVKRLDENIRILQQFEIN
jgi:hypothetical protein